MEDNTINREYRKMTILYGVNDKITKMAKIRYRKMKDSEVDL